MYNKYQTGIDPQQLSQMMAMQGAGQGVDYNGQPTPNISGEPSFADMAQEIQDRYDELIIPLQKELEKIQKKLEDNPTDKTLQNEAETIEKKIDALEKQEDMELQALEQEVEKSGQMIEQQKQMEGLANNGEYVPEMEESGNIDPQMLQEAMTRYGGQQGQEIPQEMPMMQEGGKLDPNNPLDRAKIWFNNTFGYQTDAVNNPSKKERYTIDKFSKDMHEFEDKYPALSFGLNMTNPVYAAMDMANQMKLNHDENPNSKTSVMTPLLWGLAGAAGLAGLGKIGKLVQGTRALKKLPTLIRDADTLEYAKKARDLGKKYGGIWSNIKEGAKTVGKISLNSLGYGLGNIFGQTPRLIRKDMPYLPVKIKEGKNFVKDFWPLTYDSGKQAKGFDLLTRLSLGAIPSVYSYDLIDRLIENKKINEEKERVDTAEADKQYEEWKKEKGYQNGGVITKHQNIPTLNDEQKEWLGSFINNQQKENPKGIKGYFRSTPWTQHVLMGNMIGKMMDNSARMNVNAQHQFKYTDNPYTYTYDKANREYERQLDNINKSHNLEDIYLKRQKLLPQYSSLQQEHNAKMAQQSVDNLNRLKNDSNYITSLQSVNSIFGKQANDEYKNMYEQQMKNSLLNANEDKMYLTSLNEINKQKATEIDSLMNALAIAGNRQKEKDVLYHTYLPNYLEGLKLGIDNELLDYIFGNYVNNKKSNNTTE